ncbi:alpha/beta hydrolase [Vibrio renipiscarius]|uniref:Lipase n=1 Tax=Vibrio renipiscarius TaxID=1461322 RepID=A0A0C2KB92_9VIBR|nr:alpha/beta hydrolase [Vibrio renipiscarius]KII76123.1 lipase [Vibrio renipiscarius]KII79228.1 lipase [Vibrio renipiscarius]
MKKITKLLMLSFVGLSAANANANANAVYTVEKDILFKTVKARTIKLDLYLPKTEAKVDGKYPLLVWVHGGAWKRGTKDDIPTKNPLLLNSVLSEGYALAAVDYRLSGEATFPKPVADINDAINYLHDHANKYNLAADNVVMMGRSAGGHLAGLVGASNTHGDISFYSEPKYRVAGVVSFFGPTDLLELGNKGNRPTSKKSSVSRFLGDIPSEVPELAAQASTTSYINSDAPPYIQFHGTVDKRVPLAQSQILKQTLDKYGIENQLFIEEGVGHSAPIFDTDKYVPYVIAFLKRHYPIK